MGGRRSSNRGRNCKSLHEALERLKYSRMKRHALMQTTQIKPSAGGLSLKFEKFEDVMEDQVKESESHSSHCIIQRRTNNDEENLRLLENDYLRSDADNMLESEAGSRLSCDCDASSSDTIYGEKVEPQFDLMKSVLREGYGCRSMVKKRKLAEESLEVEEVRNETGLAINGDGKRFGDGIPTERKVWPRFRDLRWMKVVLNELRRKVMVPLCHPQIPIWLGVRPISGILLHGPPGCGKTTLAHAIANEAGVPFYKISATDVVTSASGASEENIRELFLKAQKTAPSIVFIDEIDAIASKRQDLQKEMERRIVTQLMTCMDELQCSVSESSDLRTGYVLVIGATNRPDALDPALRRPGRFDREFLLGVPDEQARVDILSLLARNLKLDGDIDLVQIAKATPGFVLADLSSLIVEASTSAMERIVVHRMVEHSKEPTDGKDEEDWWKQPWSREEVEKQSISMADFEVAAKTVQPSSKREGFSTIPNVKWEDVGGLDELRLQLEEFIVGPIKHPEYHEKYGVDLEAGVLLYGPPGCGKTHIAKAVATEAGANFIHIKGPQLLDKYVGESEKAIRTIFSRARTCSPCVLFFDEIDALTTKRGKEGGWVVERFLTQFLLELDGAGPRQGVYVIGATNRPEVMDEALLRPGRFGNQLYVCLPSLHERESILKVVARKKSICSSVDMLEIARRCKNFSGADLYSLMNEAARVAVREQISKSGDCCGAPFVVQTKHFEEVLRKVKPSVSEKQRKHYHHLHRSLRSPSTTF